MGFFTHPVGSFSWYLIENRNSRKGLSA